MLSLSELLMFVGLTTLTIAWISLGFHRLRASRSADTTTPRRPDLDAVVGRPAAGAWHSPRRSHRHRIEYEMEYLSPQGSGKGKLVNLAREGWRIEGDRPVACGTVLSLRAALPTQPIQLDVEQAIVRWVDGAEFGVELLKLRPESACQLDKFLTTAIPHPGTDSLSTLSPLSYKQPCEDSTTALRAAGYRHQENRRGKVSDHRGRAPINSRHRNAAVSSPS